MVVDTNKTIGEMVADDFRTASVFSANKIDFCCKGNRTLDEVCSQKGLDVSTVLEQLEKATATDNTSIDFNTWELDLLIDYIEKKHHRYVEEKIPVLLSFLLKLEQVHGAAHPELFEIKNLFKRTADELTQHMKKEELILFPYIKKMVEADRTKSALSAPGFGSVANPIAMMMEEHENEGNRFEKIVAISNNYTPPADGCNTYKVTFQMLQEFESDLHTHIHLENNILFPKAIVLQEKFL
ncbi:iron-sulfur cluster repair di-iron protein [Flavobacterium psychraquaticum]|uniref:iron-sulfur cluster repair di-iron protein n=1 Tax=Flavobacterium psychraquaticum TaxID=3103958 RepID=UPI002ACEFB6A|nr:iron-sulfur cluster repair di-iron protein [Flavobacterium sp. LB-N7T]